MGNTINFTLVITAIIALTLGYLVGSQTGKDSEVAINLDFPTSSAANLSAVDSTLAIEMITNFQESCKDTTQAVLFDFPTIFSHILQNGGQINWAEAGFYAYFAQNAAGNNTIMLKFVDGLSSTTAVPQFIESVGFLNMGDLCPNRCGQ